MDSNASQRVLIGPYASLWVLMCLSGSLCVYMESNRFFWPLCVLMGSYVSLLVFMRPCGSFSVSLFCLCLLIGP